jgi:Ku protein
MGLPGPQFSELEEVTKRQASGTDGTLSPVSINQYWRVSMAPRAYWKGSLKLSLVTCPIALYPASTQGEKTHFHQINTKTGHRLKQQMVDEQTGRVVDKEHKGRGYELSKGRYVEIDEEELDAVKLESTHTIDIDDFVPAEGHR